MRLRTCLVFFVSLLFNCATSQNNTAELYIPGRSPGQSSDALITASLIGGSGSPTSTFLLTASGDGTGNSEVPLTLVEAATTAQLISTQTVNDISEVDVIDCQISSDISNCVATRITSDSSGLMTATFGFAEAVSPVAVVAVGFSSSPTTVDTTTSTTSQSTSTSFSSPSTSIVPPSPSPSAGTTPTSSSADSPATPSSPLTDQPTPSSNIPTSPPSLSSTSGTLPNPLGGITTSALPPINGNSARKPAPFGLPFLFLVGYIF